MSRLFIVVFVAHLNFEMLFFIFNIRANQDSKVFFTSNLQSKHTYVEILQRIKADQSYPLNFTTKPLLK